MKKSILVKASVALLSLSLCVVGLIWYTSPELIGENESEENDMYDGPDMAAKFEFDRTKDPATGIVPTQELISAIDRTSASKEADARARGIQLPPEEIGKRLLSSKTADVEGSKLGRKSATSEAADTGNKQVTADLAQPFSPSALSWTERGPNSDIAGPSNGNTRANAGIPSGRIRAMLVDASDATGKTVYIGGIAGGLWKTTDITVSPATWTLVNDKLANLSIADIFQVPGTPDTLYFSTGEGYFNGDAVQGVGIFKSTDHGANWTQLASTIAFATCNRITGDAAGNLYVGTQLAGLQRSLDGGNTWAIITPTGSSARVSDLELSSTGRLHVATGLGTSSLGQYRFTDNPTTVAAGTWTAATTPFTYPSGANCRVELGVSGNALYALPSNTSAQVATIWRSTDGGANWAATATVPSATWASGQAWYSLSIAINPADANQVIVGGLDTWKSINGGTSWTQLSTWVGTAPVNQYIHADQHKAIWYDGGNKLIFGCDGGIFYSSDSGATIRDRNVGLRIKQFYSVAIHPTTPNYFLAGAQDNGTHQLSNPGLSSSVEVTGGDGAFVAIDQDQPQFQFGAYIFNQYRRSTNSGASWTSVNLNTGTGQFINPFDYENTANIMYCGDTTGTYRRWTNPQTGSTSAVVTVSNLSGFATAVTVSPNTTNRIFLGTDASQVVRVDSADTFATGTAGTLITPAGAVGTVSNVAVGSTDNNLMAIYSNYGITNIWVSTNGGTNWTASDGNLPNMPVRWAAFTPSDNTKAYIATETGVWETDLLNGAATVWTANATFPNVRTDMIRIRASDGLIAAGTHGRGVWTALLNPTAANVTVGGRVLTQEGRGLRNAVVTLTDSHGATRQAITGPLGFYSFAEVESGGTYVVGVISRRFSFASRAVSVTDNVSDVDFVALPAEGASDGRVARSTAGPLRKGK